MKPYYEDNHIQIFNKDCRSMDELPDESVQCVITSPPYWGLRKYAGLPDLVWGGDKDCEHQWGQQIIARQRGSAFGETSVTKQTYAKTQGVEIPQGNFCSLCGAWKGSYGLEPTPELYLSHSIEILREIRRVLRKDGVVFWNIGDSYMAHPFNSATVGGFHGKAIRANPALLDATKSYATRPSKHPILKDKDLCLIPFRVAIAAQQDGWWVRSVIIWSKPNPMPESVTDRPTESHEYILMLTKSGTTQYWTHRDGGGTRERPKADYRWLNQLTNEEVAIEPAGWKEKIPCSGCNGTGKETAVLWGDYEVEIGKCPKCGGKGKVQLWRRINLWRGHDYYWDADAVREPHTWIDRDNLSLIGKHCKTDGDPLADAYNMIGRSRAERYNPAGRNIRSVWEFPEEIIGEAQIIEPKVYHYEGDEDKTGGIAFYRGTPNYQDPRGRNLRSVWSFPTQPYPKAHFAVFPEKLAELCIKAATPEVGCCSKCGAPWERVIQKESMPRLNRQVGALERNDPDRPSGMELAQWRKEHPIETLGWQPTCSCNADKVPSIVLDPFLGTGTTLWVAKILGRRGRGYELSEAYCALSLERNRQMVMELTS